MVEFTVLYSLLIHCSADSINFVNSCQYMFCRLFDSPKTKAPDSDWLRKDVDDPALFVSKKSLIHKLDQIACEDA